ncbi:MAG: hypothetical protein KDD94_08250, partial [Calditrichaeota bacterium]|nr:hypothetical protein [Calditrichota bacterium]
MKQISLITEIRPVFRKSQYELVISLIEALISRDIRLIYSGVECDLFSEIHLICKKNRRQLSGVFPSELKGLIAL